MGAALGALKCGSTIDRLEQVERKIQKFEEMSQKIQQRKVKILQNFTAISILIYLGFITYYLKSNLSWAEQFLWLLILITTPVFITYTRSMIKWWYQEKAASNYKKLEKLYNQKQQLLKDLMEREELMMNSDNAHNEQDECSNEAHSLTALPSSAKMNDCVCRPPTLGTHAQAQKPPYNCKQLITNYHLMQLDNMHAFDHCEKRLDRAEQLKQVFKHLATSISAQNITTMERKKKTKSTPDDSSTAWPSSSDDLSLTDLEHRKRQTAKKLQRESRANAQHQTKIRRKHMARSNESKTKCI